MHSAPKSRQQEMSEHVWATLTPTINFPYAPGELQMEPEMEGCLYPCGGAISAQVAVNSIPPEPQLSWLSGRYIIMPF
jgi:hypothetical protein